jgi:hypothetical protein
MPGGAEAGRRNQAMKSSKKSGKKTYRKPTLKRYGNIRLITAWT